MNVEVHLDGWKRKKTFEDANFSIGLSMAVGELTAAGAVATVNKYFPTGDLWVFQMRPNAEGTMVRHNVAFYPSGKFDEATMVEPARVRKSRVH